MVFNDLPIGLQNLYMVNVEFFLKIIFVLFVAFYCYMQIKKSKEKEDTPYLLVAIKRTFLGFLSRAILFILPLLSLFLFFPQFEVSIIIQYVLINKMISLRI